MAETKVKEKAMMVKMKAKTKATMVQTRVETKVVMNSPQSSALANVLAMTEIAGLVAGHALRTTSAMKKRMSNHPSQWVLTVKAYVAVSSKI